MPYLGDRSARLFYDDSCGPCRFFAEVTAGVSRHRVTAIPLEAPAATAALGDLPSETRYGYAHLVTEGARRTGEEITVPLVGLTVGRTGARVVRGVPFLERALRRMYLRAWQRRRARGCGTPAAR
jgi:hypothetical protein